MTKRETETAMKMVGTPIVYAGPTLSAAAVQHAYPGCIVRPPIRRGDLYRDRMLRGAVFLILDGVFFQDEAVSPREILDVIADGALVVGAASMGALRAAECWPAGMRGVGSIYRLFRSGALESDDEVAVAFSAPPEAARTSASDVDRRERTSSVALINVRYALRCALSRGLLAADAAQRVLAAASEMFYADRHWPLILRTAGLEGRPQLVAALASHDLKALDATRALGRVKRWLRETPGLLERPRATRTAFTPSDETRERGYDATAVEPNAAVRREQIGRGGAVSAEPELRLQFATWLYAMGRHTRYAEQLAAALNASAGELLRDFLVQSAAHAELLWLVLDAAHELDAELFRFHAQRLAAARAAAASVRAAALDQHRAERRIATHHGFPSWAALTASLADCPEALSLITEHGRRAALAQAAVRADFTRVPQR